MIPGLLAAVAAGRPDDGGGGGGGGGDPYVDVVKADSPFFYWRLGESAGATTAADESGNGNTGTYQNSPNFEETGAISGDADTAVGFDSAESEYILADSRLGDWATFAAAGARSMEFWIKTTEASRAAIFGTANDGNTTFLSFHLNREADGTTTAGHTAFRVRDEDDDIYAESWDDSVVDIYDGAYHHVVVVQDGHTTWRIYVDGTQVSTTTFSLGGTYSNPGTWGYPLAVAAYNIRSTISDFPDVTLDEVAFYNSALSEERVSAHFAAA